MRILWVSLLVVTAFAGCADEAGGEPDADGPVLDVSEDTGGIRGVVVDQSIVPVAGATVTLLSSQESVVTDEKGLFSFSRLDPGTYFLAVQKLLYEGVQTSVDVVAGVAEPKLLNIQIARLTDKTPYIDTVQFDGFYECAFAWFFITDSCDMAVRTVHDAGVSAVPRNVQNNVNTMFYPWSADIVSIVQETFWDPAATPELWSFVDSTPIDNGCDCSDHTYLEAQGPPNLYANVTRPAEPKPPGNWPTPGEEVALRAFIPFTGAADPAYAISVDFQMFTSFFFNYPSPDGWNFEDKNDYPVPE